MHPLRIGLLTVSHVTFDSIKVLAYGTHKGPKTRTFNANNSQRAQRYETILHCKSNKAHYRSAHHIVSSYLALLRPGHTHTAPNGVELEIHIDGYVCVQIRDSTDQPTNQPTHTHASKVNGLERAVKGARSALTNQQSNTYNYC